jgi:hypothetical protein
MTILTRLTTWATISVALALTSGCATMIKPEELKRPQRITCFDLKEEIEGHDLKGLLKISWTTRISSGPYVSEYEDVEGIYFRAPTAGLFISMDDLIGKPSVKGLIVQTFDGGIWLPKIPGKLPHLYTYFSAQDAENTNATKPTSCTDIQNIVVPKTIGVSVKAFAFGGGMGGAAGATIAKATSPNASISYGQAAGAGLVGGAIGGAITAAMINKDVGKIVHQPITGDPLFNENILNLQHSLMNIPADKIHIGE